MFDLSKKQHEVLSVLGRFAGAEGRMPSVRELADELSLAPATTQQPLRALCAKGYLRAHGRAHGLELLPRAWAHLRSAATTTEPELVRVPVVGWIAAGVPIEAVEDLEETLPLP